MWGNVVAAKTMTAAMPTAAATQRSPFAREPGSRSGVTSGARSAAFRSAASIAGTPRSAGAAASGIDRSARLALPASSTSVVHRSHVARCRVTALRSAVLSAPST